MSDRNVSSLSSQAVRTRSILRNTYLWMTGGLALTGVVAYAVASNPTIVQALVSNMILFFALIVGELILVIYLSRRIMTLSPGAAVGGFALYAALNGVTLSFIFLAYTGTAIARVFFITAGTFAGVSLYAATTRRDLSGIGQYLIMGLWGIIIASLVNFFLRSETLYWIISYIGVAVFIGLTAYDTQIIKRWSDQHSDSVAEVDYMRLSILGALKLYLDFINLFLFFLRIFGRRR
jgi:FtsH-binding integral membrane protein